MLSYLRGLVQPHRQFKMFYDKQYKRVLRDWAKIGWMAKEARELMSVTNDKLDALSGQIHAMHEQTIASTQDVAELEKQMGDYRDIPTPKLH